MNKKWPASPFHVGGAVSSDRRFVDRTRLLETLLALIEDEESRGFLLKGPRRAGKSSVLERLGVLARDRARVVVLDIFSILGSEEDWAPQAVTQTVLSAMMDAIERQHGSIPDLVRELVTGRSFDVNSFRRRALPELLKCGESKRRLVILFDEMEVAEARDRRAPVELAASLQPLPGFSDCPPLLGIVWGRGFGRGLPRDTPSIFKDFPPEYLLRFEEKEIPIALTQPLDKLYSWSKSSVDHVWSLTAGHPLFVAAIGAAVHARRKEHDLSIVEIGEVSAAIQDAVKRTESWDDAWRQLSHVQQLFLRALAETAPSGLEEVSACVNSWGAAYEPLDFRQYVQGFVEDEVIEATPKGLQFQVELMRQRVLRVGPAEILSAPEDFRESALMGAIRHERAGRDFYASGQFTDAEKAFRAALEEDPGRWSAAVGLAQILFLHGREEEAAQRLRAATPGPEVNRVRIQALTRCVLRAVERHEDPLELIAELRSIDPQLEGAPEVLSVVAASDIERWWASVVALDPPAAVTETDRAVIARGPKWISAALRCARGAVQDALEGRELLEPLTAVASQLLPHLLAESEPSVLTGAENAQSASELTEAWRRCYVSTVEVLGRLTSDPSRFGSKDVPASAFAKLLGCMASKEPIGAPLVDMVRRLATKDRLAELACIDDGATRTAVAVVEFLGGSEAQRRLLGAFEDAALAAAVGSSEALLMAWRALPSLGNALVRRRFSADEPTSARDASLAAAAGMMIDRLEADPVVAISAASDESWTEWSAFVEALGRNDPADGIPLRRRLEGLRPRASGLVSDLPLRGASLRATAEDVQKILGDAYKVGRQVPYRIHGIPPSHVSAWTVDRLGQSLLARVYHVKAAEPAMRSLLSQLWDNERRLLSTLATRWEGRALPRLYVSRFDANLDVLVLVTDWVGPRSLRDLLDSGEIAQLRRASRATLWTHLHGVIDALAALHQAGYLHRAVRPENVVVDAGGRSHTGRPWLLLANFEWSVYLYQLAQARAIDSHGSDRYAPPEHFVSGSSELRGEGPASDAFTLGLLLFECLVGPLHAEELTEVSSSRTWQQHTAWVTELLKRVDQEKSRGGLWSDEVVLLKDLLNPDPARRATDLAEMSERVARLTQQETPEEVARAAGPLPLVTTLSIGTPEAIQTFINQNLPDKAFPDVASLRRWLEDELLGAAVRPNRRASAPLLLMGKTLSFTVEPFRFLGKVHWQVGWLKVARDQDGPAGPVLHQLRDGVALHNYRPDLALASLVMREATWAPWFESVSRLRAGVTAAERAFIERMRWTVELERKAWQRQVFRYELDSYEAGARPGQLDVAVVRDAGEGPNVGTYELWDLLAQSLDRDNTWFDLGTSRDPVAPFKPEQRWMITPEPEDESGRVWFTRPHRDDARRPPQSGWIRPYSFVGHRVLYRRRREVLEDLENDPFLVRSILTPKEVYDDFNLPAQRVFERHLDEDKQRLAIAIQNRRPLFTVQGPPGTGKTTLAAEVILRTLADHPSSRILVVAQAHDPLNNLLERVLKAVDEWKRSGGAPRGLLSIRLTSEERMDPRRYSEESTRIARAHHPSTVAAGLVRRAAEWRPPAGKGFRPEVVNAWRNLTESQALHGVSRSLERRLVNSANLIYATANDRRLAAIRPGSFDLVIYEEAAKAFPVELIGPLRLARRWLLIGDQKQLPPFGLLDVDAALKGDLERLRKNHRDRKPVAADAVGIDPAAILGDDSSPPDLWAAIEAEMTRMFRFFGYVIRQAARVPLGSNIAGMPESESGAIVGLTGMLTTQWRMHPVIGQLVSHCFYEDKIKNGDPKKLATWRQHGFKSPSEIVGQAIVWLDIPHCTEEPLAADRPGFGGGWENGFEARVLLGFARQLLVQKGPSTSLAILSPYRAQVGVLAGFAKNYRFPVGGDLVNNIHTADSFQGNQADLVLVSLVRNNLHSRSEDDERITRGLGFLESPERATVIFSRAERLLVVAGCLNHLCRFEDTTMCRVATRVRELAEIKDSGVRIIDGRMFLDKAHWESLERRHAESELRDRQRRERRRAQTKEVDE